MNGAIGFSCFLIAACGASSKQNELIGQVKSIKAKTPIICGDYDEVDLSLGVMRNGVGSMSTSDQVLYVVNETDRRLLKQSQETGKLVKVTYDVERVTFCVPDHWATHVEILDDAPAVKP